MAAGSSCHSNRHCLEEVIDSAKPIDRFWSNEQVEPPRREFSSVAGVDFAYCSSFTLRHKTTQTVSKWRARFVEHRLDGLLDAARPGEPRTIDGARVDAVIAKTLESRPQVATH